MAGCFSLTHAQKRIWHNEIMYPDFEMANVGYVIKFLQRKNPLTLELAINKVLRENQGLRIRLKKEGNAQVKQYVSEYKWTTLDVLNEEPLEDILPKIEVKQREKFAILDADLFYFALLQFGDDKIGLYVKMHHIIVDGISAVVIIQQVQDAYNMFEEGEAVDEVRPAYREYVDFEYKYLSSDKYIRDEKYWLEKYKAVPDASTTVSKKDVLTSMRIQRYYFSFPQEMHEEIKMQINETGASYFVYLAVALAVYFSRYKRQKEIVIGRAVHNRLNRRFRDMIGMFVTNLPFKVDIDENMTFVEMIQALQKDLWSDLRHQQFPYDKLIDKLRENKMSVRNLINIQISENPVFKTKEFEIIEQYFAPYQNTELFFLINPRNTNESKTEIALDFQRELFTDDEIHFFVERLMIILGNLLANPEKKLLEVPTVTNDEHKRVTHVFNCTKREYPLSTIPQVFDSVVQKHGGRVAVKSRKRTYTYRQLDEASNVLATALLRRGTKKNSFVAVMTGRSTEYIIAVLAILKSGAAYLPIDPDYPTTRKAFMLADGEVNIVLADDDSVVPMQYSHTVIRISNAIAAEEAGSCVKQVSSSSIPGDLAYIMYTSGTTGEPKGVLITHQNVMRLVRNSDYITITAGDVIVMTGSISFDANTFEIWGALLNGGCLYIAEKNDIISPDILARLIGMEKADILWLTAPLFNNIVEEREDVFDGLKYLLVGGDVLSCQHIAKVLNRKSNVKIINGYGPTENTTFSACYAIHKISGDAIPIGQPISNSTVYILDQYLHPLPIGSIGEICVGGDGVGKGYWKSPQLTEEKFMDNPFCKGDRLYRTGDFAYWTKDGNLMFVGRKDNQIKIRGHRVELAEVEKQMMRTGLVKNVAVIDEEDEKGDKYLAAFYTSVTELPPEAVRASLLQSLPEYMVPRMLIPVENIPLNQSGKVNRNELRGIVPQQNKPTYPRGKTVTKNEEEMLAIFAEVLGRDIELEDNFFAIGGHSLDAMSIITRIKRTWGIEFPAQLFFAQSNVGAVVRYVEMQNKLRPLQLPRAKSKDYYALSDAQQRIYVASMMAGNLTTYNMPLAYRITGNFNEAKLIRALETLIKRHSILRTRFVEMDGLIVQHVLDSVHLTIEKFCETDNAESIAGQFVRAFNLADAPLMHVGIAHISDRESLLFLDIHHIVCDGVSCGRLLDELKQIYLGQTLSANTFQYIDFAEWDSAWKKSDAYKNQGEYWRKELASHPQSLDLPTDFPRRPFRSYNGDSIECRLDLDAYNKVGCLAAKYETTPFTVFMSLLALILYKYSAQSDIVVGTAVSGRTHADLEEIIGMFVNVVPIRMELGAELNFGQLIKRVRSKVIGAIENQAYELEDILRDINFQIEPGRNPLFDIVLITQDTMFSRTSNIFELGEVTFTQEKIATKTAKYDISMEITAAADTVRLKIEYNKDLYYRESMERMGLIFTNLTKKIGQLECMMLKDIEIIDAKEKRLIIETFNDNAFEYPSTLTFADLFAKVVSQNPGNIAVTCGNITLSYADLNSRAEQVAGYLLNRGIGAGDVVGLLTEQNIEFIVGMLGVLKTGAAFLPIDRETPAVRISLILTESNARGLMMTMADYEEKVLAVLDYLNEAHHIAIRNAECSNEIRCCKLFEGRELPSDIADDSCEELPVKMLHLDIFPVSAGVKRDLPPNKTHAICGFKEARHFRKKHTGTNFSEEKYHVAVDDDFYQKLYRRIQEFKPDVIGIDFLSQHYARFRSIIQLIRQWGFRGTIVAVGLYAANNYRSILKDYNVDFVVVGEVSEAYDGIISAIQKNRSFPNLEQANKICGIAFNECNFGMRGESARKRFEMLCLDQQIGDIHASKNPGFAISSNDVAYVIYTSGTTGVPKGVAITNRSLLNLCFWHNNAFKVTAEDRAAKYAGVAFDASIWEVFPYLLAGAQLFIVPAEIRHDLPQLKRFIDAQEISIAFLPTQVYEQFKGFHCPTLRILLTGGDKLTRVSTNSYKLYNNYGPTENAVVSTSCAVSEDSKVISIGKPINNVFAYVLDEGHNLLPIGAKGEIYLGGDNLSPGYINSKELTDISFIKDPFRPGETMYKTGDEARWLPNGNLEFLGRKDSQIKLRGYRIEPAEIEQVMKNHPGIIDAAVVAKTDDNGDKFLCAFFVALSVIDPQMLLQEMKKILPFYMIPSGIKQMASLPINRNGKIDKKSLGSEPVARWHLKSTRLPTTVLEKTIAGIWSELLGCKSNIGVDENFFEAGGNSLKMIKLITRIKHLMRHDTPLNLSAFMQNPTIETITRYLKDDIHKTRGTECVVFNTAGRKVFCFHSLAGDENEYRLLAEHISSYSLHSLHVDYARPIAKPLYADYIEQHRQNGEAVVLAGYSSGGIIAFSVAQELELRGVPLGGVIMLDSFRINDENKHKIMSDVLNKFGNFRDTWDTGILECCLNNLADIDYGLPISKCIYNIRSARQREHEISKYSSWEMCTREFHVMDGYGDHSAMLKADSVAMNAALISQALNSILI